MAQRVPDVAFIVPFWNEEGFLSETLSTLQAQELNGSYAEVLLVDGMSSDGCVIPGGKYVSARATQLHYNEFEVD